jgi:hypothetical protein
MALESSKERLFWQGVVPIVGAVIGAVCATWFQASTIDQAQLSDVIALLKDPQLSAQQKIQALEIYKEISDRPWSVVRSLVNTFTLTVSVVIGALIYGGIFDKHRKQDSND